MANLETSYMGVALKNPLIVGANSLSSKLEYLRKAQEAGVGAIVYRSLFEEQILLEEWRLNEDLDAYADRHAEMVSLFPRIKHAGPEEFLIELRRAREAVNIPLFASLNCVYKESWPEYAKMLAETGVDGLELNFYAIPKDCSLEASDIEGDQIEILKAVKAAVNIPVAVKISPYYTNVLNFVKRLDEAGADSVVMFNRLFQPEINIDDETNYFPWNMSGKRDSRLALRFVGLLYGNVNAGLVAANGILDSNSMIQLFLAGADSVQVVSALFQNKIEYAAQMLAELDAWMDKKGYKSLDDLRGKLSRKNSDDPFAYKRAQYVDLLINSKGVFDKYDLV